MNVAVPDFRLKVLLTGVLISTCLWTIAWIGVGISGFIISLIPRDSNNVLILIAILGAIGGALAGLGQWLSLCQWIKERFLWVLATACGWAILCPVIFHVIIFRKGGVGLLILAAVLGGLATGFGQWLILRRYMSKAGGWVVTTGISWLAAFGIPETLIHFQDHDIAEVAQLFVGTTGGILLGGAVLLLLKQLSRHLPEAQAVDQNRPVGKKLAVIVLAGVFLLWAPISFVILGSHATPFCPPVHKYSPFWHCQVMDERDNKRLLLHFDKMSGEVQLSTKSSYSILWLDHPFGKIKDFKEVSERVIRFDPDESSRWLLIDKEKYPIRVINSFSD